MTDMGPVETIGLATGLAVVAMASINGLVKLASRKAQPKTNGTLCREHGERIAKVETSFEYLKEGQQAQWDKLDRIEKLLIEKR